MGATACLQAVFSEAHWLQATSGTPQLKSNRALGLSSRPSGVYNLGRGDLWPGAALAYRLPRAMGASVNVGVGDIPAWRALSWRRLGFAEPPAPPSKPAGRPGQEPSRIATPRVMALENAGDGCFSENH